MGVGWVMIEFGYLCSGVGEIIDFSECVVLFVIDCCCVFEFVLTFG